MRVDWIRATSVLVLLALGSCSGGNDPGGALGSPSELSAEAVAMTTVRVSWKAAGGDGVAGYEIQRRKDLHGGFETIEPSVSPGTASRVVYFDTKVDPNTYYGYRVRAVSKFGSRSPMTNIAGTKTAQSPGLLIQTSTVAPNAESSDPDGYVAVIRGARDTTSVALAVNAQRLVALPRGSYSVALRGLASNCATTVGADTVKTATVTDEGTETVVGVSFIVSCRDPKKASLVVIHNTTGDSLDADGLALTVSGIIKEAGTPANERVFFATRKLEGRSASVRFDNLRLGDYEVSVADVDPPCTLSGDPKRMLSPRALAVDTILFALTCRKPPTPVDTVGRPFILRSRWSSTTARPGDKVSLLASLDLRAQASQEVAGVQATIGFDDAVVRFDSSRTMSTFDITTVSQPTPGLLAMVATNTTGQGVSGDVQIVRMWFTVVGAVGASVRTTTTIEEVLTPTLLRLNDKVRPEESTLTISNAGGPTNVPPTATIAAPATATVGAAVTFSGAQSRDTDGSITSYAWTFGDNSSGSGVSTTHTYATAGTYAVRLTVTDDKGATGTADHSIVVSPAAATTGTVSGTVTSQQGALGGVTVTVTGAPATATTNASGEYTVANVATGSQTVSLSGLPATCTAPSTQTVTVAASAAATANFTVQCTPAGGTTGSITGIVKRADNTPISGASVIVQPTGGTALGAVSTGSDGKYTVNNVPIGTGVNAGAGSITLSGLPNGCTNPGSQSYTGLTAASPLTKDITVTCAATGPSGKISGKITKSSGGDAADVVVTATPAAGAAVSSAPSDAQGAYTVNNVPVGAGNLGLSQLPLGCSAPTSGLDYTGLAANQTLTKNIVLTCSSGGHTYTLSAAWGSITTGGPTGRQVTMTFSIDMGAAPGRPEINGSGADPLNALQLDLLYNGTLLRYASRQGLSDLDLNIVNEFDPGTAGAKTRVILGGTAGQSVTGSAQLVRVTYNIATGASGSVTPTIVLTEVKATTSLLEVKAFTIVAPIPALTIP